MKINVDKTLKAITVKATTARKFVSNKVVDLMIIKTDKDIEEKQPTFMELYDNSKKELRIAEQNLDNADPEFYDIALQKYEVARNEFNVYCKQAKDMKLKREFTMC